MQIASGEKVEEANPTPTQEEADPPGNSSASPPDAEDVRKATYDFEAQSSFELSVTAGERVRLLCRHDNSGSEEWCLVRNEAGKEGYIPTHFLGRPYHESQGYS